MGGLKGLDGVRQAQLPDGRPKVTQGLGVGLHGAVCLAFDLAGLEVEGDDFVERGHFATSLNQVVTHITLAGDEVKLEKNLLRWS